MRLDWTNEARVAILYRESAVMPCILAAADWTNEARVAILYRESAVMPCVLAAAERVHLRPMRV